MVQARVILFVCMLAILLQLVGTNAQKSIVVNQAEAQLVPEWVKGVAGFWAEGKISESEFLQAIEFLIREGIIKLNTETEAPTFNNNTQIELSSNTDVMSFNEKSQDFKDNNPEIAELSFKFGRGEITQPRFLADLQSYVDNGTIKSFSGMVDDNSSKPLPDWIRNNLNWYGENMINNYDYYQMLKWMYSNGYLRNP